MTQTGVLYKTVMGPRHGAIAIVAVTSTSDETDIATALPGINEGHYVTIRNDGDETVYYMWAEDDTAAVDETATDASSGDQRCWAIGAGEERSEVPPEGHYYLIHKTASNTSTLRVAISSDYRS